MTSTPRNWPSLIGRSSGEVRHLNATWQQEMPGRLARIVEARDLRGDVREIDLHLVAGDLDPHADRDALADVTPSSSMNDSAS